MDYYTIVSRDNNVLIDLLLSEVVENNIKSLNDWRTCYYYGIDGILVNMVYNLIQDNKMYNRERIDTEFDILLKPIYNKTSKLNDNQFYDIFNNIWYCKFGIIECERKTIKKIASDNQPFLRRIINTDKFIIIYSVFLLILSGILGGVYSFIGMMYLIMFGAMAISNYGLMKGYIISFTIMCVMSFFISLLTSVDDYSNWNKYLLLSFILYLTYYPVININIPRVKEESEYRNKIKYNSGL